MGVDPTYESEPFYNGTLDGDTQRVNKLFSEASTSGVVIERRSLTPTDLQAMPFVKLHRHPPSPSPNLHSLTVVESSLAFPDFICL